MLNYVVVQGRITRDIELKRTQSGVAVTSFTVACERDFKSQSGEKETDFIDVVAWKNTAEFISKYFQKGQMILLQGRLQVRDWQDRDGNKRRAYEIITNNAYFGESKKDTQQSNMGALQGRLDNAGFEEITEIEQTLPF